MKIITHVQKVLLSTNDGDKTDAYGSEPSEEINGRTTFDPPEGAANVTATVVTSGDGLWQVCTWIELSASERAEMMMNAARNGGLRQ